MTRIGIVVSLTLTLMGTAVPAWAQATRRISPQEARGVSGIITLELYDGHGVTLNFRSADTLIRQVWLDDPSQVTLDFDDSRCLTITETCAATLIHLRRIQPLTFPGLPATATTTLTVVTDQDLYTFQLTFPNIGTPTYRILDIQPEPPTVISSPVAGILGAQQVEQGLLVAHQQHLVTTQDPLWEKLQILLDRLRQGVPMPEAASAAGVSEALVLYLVELGR